MFWNEIKDWKKWILEHDVEIIKDKNPKLIFEGSDGAGKSSIIDIVMNIIGHTLLFHTSAPKNGSTPNYYYELLDTSIELLKVSEQPFIYDRCHIGEAVYGKIFRNYNFDWNSLDQKLYDLDVKLIYVKADIDTLIKRVNDRGDWFINSKDILPITNLYEEKINESKLPTYIIDTTKNITKEDIIDLIKFIYS